MFITRIVVCLSHVWKMEVVTKQAFSFFGRDTDKIGKCEARRAAKWLDVGDRMVKYGENEGFA